MSATTTKARQQSKIASGADAQNRGLLSFAKGKRISSVHVQAKQAAKPSAIPGETNRRLPQLAVTYNIAMAAARRQVVVDLGPGLFLTSEGQFLSARPVGAVLMTTSPVELPLTENAKSVLKGQSLQTMDKKFGTKVLDELGISQDFRDLASNTAELAGNIASVVGWVGAAIQIAKALGIFGPTGPTQMDVIARQVDEIHNAVFGLARDFKIDFITDQRKVAFTAGDDLKEILLKTSISSSDRVKLEKNLTDLRAAWFALTRPDVQNLPFVPTEYQRIPWYFRCFWLDPISLAARQWTGMQSGSMAIPPLRQINAGNYRWDYRMFLPPVVEATIGQLAHFVALDPLYRTTGRYRGELMTMRDTLTDFAENMLSCVQWTRDYNSISDKYYQPMAYGWPVGAADICSGASSFNPWWSEGLQYDHSFKPGPNDNALEPPPVFNVQDCLQRAAEQRSQDFMAVFLNGGIPEFLIFIAHINEMANVPSVSETVSVSVRKLGARKKVGTATRTFKATSVCNARDFTADVYHFPREFIVNVTQQPPPPNNEYKIPYHYYLESYSGNGVQLDRKELKEVRGAVDLHASCFDWEVEELVIARSVGSVASSSTLRQVAQTILDPNSPTRSYPGLVDPKTIFDWEKMQWGDDPNMPGMATQRRIAPIHIDYDSEIADSGDRVIHLRNRPEDGSFDQLYLVVEEVPGPAQDNLPPIRTSVDVGMIGLEYHLPSEYFQYLGNCLNKAAALLDKIHHLAQVSQVPIPRWDPWQYQSIGNYVEAVQQEHPELLKGIAGLQGFR